METTTQMPRTAKIRTDSRLHEFFIDQLKDIYWAEKKMVKALAKLSEAATSPRLKQAFNDHLIQTQTHVSRLENVFTIADEEAQALKCPAMAGIIDEGEDIIDETEQGTAQRDVGLIFAGQKAEHYEIATYGGMIQVAETLGYTDAVQLLKLTLTDEKKADQLLSSIADEATPRALQETKND